MPIRELWTVHEARPGPYEAWLTQMQERGTVVRAPALGLARQHAGALVQVLWPRFHAEAGTGAKVDPILTVNDNSLVVRIDFAGRRVLFTGDIEAEAEELLVTRDSEALRADVVKVPHHGSRTSSSFGFVHATEALVAVISCGRANRFGFPDSGVQQRWAETADLVLRTDEVGSITLSIWPTGQMHLQTHAPF
jgi:competence protein ComEC